MSDCGNVGQALCRHSACGGLVGRPDRPGGLSYYVMRLPASSQNTGFLRKYDSFAMWQAMAA